MLKIFGRYDVAFLYCGIQIAVILYRFLSTGIATQLQQENFIYYNYILRFVTPIIYALVAILHAVI